MDRKFLESQGLESETIDAIMTEYGKAINPLKSSKETLESEVQGLKDDLKSRDDQLETLKNENEDVEGLQSRIETLKSDNQEKDNQRKKAIDELKLDYELRFALKEAGARNDKAVKSLIDLDTVKLNEDGQLVGLKEQLETVKESDGYLFETAEETDGESGGEGDSKSTEKSKSSNDYVPGSDKKGNGGKEVTDEDRGKDLAARLFPTKEED